MPMYASGPFEVKLTPQSKIEKGDGVALARLTVEKQFHGGLEATTAGEMLSAGTGVNGSAGYVAIEWVDGTLDGRRGSFVLQHTGVMTRGTPRLDITVVPDSGTGELVGLQGTMAVEIADGKHSYQFQYTLGTAS
jgi:hypothetical protein